MRRGVFACAIGAATTDGGGGGAGGGAAGGPVVGGRYITSGAAPGIFLVSGFDGGWVGCG